MKNTIKLLSLIIIPAIALSCNSGSDTTTTAVDTSMTAVSDNTATKMDTAGKSTPMDTSMAGMKNLKDTMPVKIIPGKNGKRAKIVIVLPKMSSTSAMNADKEGIYDNVEVWPSYPGGQKALENFFSNNIEYPQQATDNSTEGTVNVSFLVDENGKVSSPRIVGKKIGDGLEDETMRVFNKMPNWTPGKIKGKNVKTRFTLPVRFQLES